MPESFAQLEDASSFHRRHLGAGAVERAQMLDALGLGSIDELIDAAVPGTIHDHRALALPEPSSEDAVLRRLTEIAQLNDRRTSCIGLGIHDTVTPAVIRRNVLEDPGWYTAYTPYQPEISQGRLEALLVFQTMVTDLTGTEIAGASLLDEATAAAEGAQLCRRVSRKKIPDRELLLVDAGCHPQTIAVVTGRARPMGVEVVVGDVRAVGGPRDPDGEVVDLDRVTAAVLQSPDTDGVVHDDAEVIAALHAADVLVTVATDLLACTLITPPGEIGADVVVGSAQRFGVPMFAGGPHAAFLATRERHARQLPGRLVGVSRDTRGREAYRLALQTREQHIRREKATSNICTAQVLLAVVSAMYAVHHGPDGLARIARRVHLLTSVLRARLVEAGFEVLGQTWFDTITLRVPGGAHALRDAAAEAGYELGMRPGTDGSLEPGDPDHLRIAFDEVTTAADVATLVEVLTGARADRRRGEASGPARRDNSSVTSRNDDSPVTPSGVDGSAIARADGPQAPPRTDGSQVPPRTDGSPGSPTVGTPTTLTADDVAGHAERLLTDHAERPLTDHASTAAVGTGGGLPGVPAHRLRTTGYLDDPRFHRYRSETELVRWLRELKSRDIALDRSMIPLGSCTMKLNAAAEMEAVSWPRFAGIHPFAPVERLAGTRAIIADLEAWLAELTGYDAVSLQPNSGAQGELAGLLAIRGYHRANGDEHRDVCLIPSSAHGTNAASAVMAGMRVRVVACDQDGNVDVDDLKRLVTEHADDLAALMVTYPSTHGVFEGAIEEICAQVHDHGGQVYLDGANLNALVGVARPGWFGADVSHLNLHKTFCIPHGGGGPGVGPVACRAHLAAYLPAHPLQPASWHPASAAIDATQRTAPVAAAPWGSAGILQISWAYVMLMGGSGLRAATQDAILAANYVAHRLAEGFPVLYTGADGLVAHEAIVDIRGIKDASGVTNTDVAKRLIDFGFHAPTMSFPVAGTLMIEPTESEAKVELDRFCDAMLTIRAEIDEVATGRWPADDNPLVSAPHPAEDVVADDWAHPYSREAAAYPFAGRRADKYWPPVSRVDDAHGDRHLVCACPPIEAYAD